MLCFKWEYYGGAISLNPECKSENGYTLTLKNVRFTNCHASSAGGAVYSVYAKDGNISKCVFERCSAVYIAGAIYYNMNKNCNTLNIGES